MFLPSVGDGIPDVMLPVIGANVLILDSFPYIKISPSVSSPDGDKILAPSVIFSYDDEKSK